MLRTRYQSEIHVAAAKWELDPILVEAVVVQESTGNTDAFRFEPVYWNRYLKGNPRYRGLNPRRVSSSYGLMQVMYSRVLEDKIAENDVWQPELLFIPENGLDVGCGFLAELLAWGETLSAPQGVKEPELATLCALAAYNGGRGGNDPSKNWPLRNGKYARDVLSVRDKLRAEYAAV